MGREIRRVPANWEHPKKKRFDYLKHIEVEEYRPLMDRPFAKEMREWYAAWEKWEAGEKPDGAEDCESFFAWEGGPPDPEYHRPDWKPEAMTWFQMYETVSEGTPCTPPFATKAELVDWLVEKGESHGTQYERRYTRAQAEAFVEQEWAPSMVMSAAHGVQTGIEACETMRKNGT